MKYPVGTTYFKRRGKEVVKHTVIDYYTTKNMARRIVKSRYVTAHELMGQLLIDYDVTQTEIDKAKFLETLPL